MQGPLRLSDIILKTGDWKAAIRPELGGALVGLWRGDVPVLRETPAASDVLDAACFPLVPFCNRIADGRFTFSGHDVEIAPNLPGQAHPLHGFGWRARWDVLRTDAAGALLEHRRDAAPDWPWAYRAHQHFALDAKGITVRLMVENRSGESAPVGLGLHPYFRRRDDVTVTFDAEAMLGIDAAFLPDGKAYRAEELAAWSEGAALPDVLVDHCFARWGGLTTIADDLGTITLRGFGAPHLHVFAPPGGSELCAEPVGHTPDALNRDPAAMTLLPPGACAGIAMRIEALSAA